MITEQQYQRLMKEHAKSGVLGTAAMKAGMHRETAAKYLAAGQGPQPEKRRGRRRPDPLTTIWAAAERLLIDAPELEAKALFEHLLAGGAAPEAQSALRTFQRRVLSWRRHHGPPKEVFFPQAREPGQSLQFDWTHAAELGVTIAGQKWEQLLCHAVLPCVKLEIGTTQENQNGKLVRKDDYCWVIASRDDRSTSLDAYNMGLRFSDDDKILVFEDKFIDQDGENIRRLDVV